MSDIRPVETSGFEDAPEAEPWPSVREHFEDVLDCPAAVQGDVFTTTWTSGGATKARATERIPGQNDAGLKGAHSVQTVVDMAIDPPDGGTDIVSGRFDADPDNITTTVGT